MPTVLRAYGTDFDVDAFLVGCELPVCAVKRRGEPREPLSQPQGRKHERSGIHVTVRAFSILLLWKIAGVSEVVAALGGGEPVEGLAAEGVPRRLRPRLPFAYFVFDLPE